MSPIVLYKQTAATGCIAINYLAAIPGKAQHFVEIFGALRNSDGIITVLLLR